MTPEISDDFPSKKMSAEAKPPSGLINPKLAANFLEARRTQQNLTNHKR